MFHKLFVFDSQKLHLHVHQKNRDNMKSKIEENQISLQTRQTEEQRAQNTRTQSREEVREHRQLIGWHHSILLSTRSSTLMTVTGSH